MLLGFWLISGAAIRAAHLAAIGIFLLFAALSTYQVIRGVPSCGCLGKLYVHPAWMLTFDLVTLSVLSALWFAERRKAPASKAAGDAKPDRSAFAYVVSASAVSGVALVALLAAGWTFAGSFEGALGVASGRDIVISPSTIDLGSGTVGEKKQATVRIVNASPSPVRIVGRKNSCGCLVTGELPVMVPARGSVEFPITVTVRKDGFREVVFTLFTDHPDQRIVEGRVRMNGEAASADASAKAEGS